MGHLRRTLEIAPSFSEKLLASPTLPYAAIGCAILLFLFFWFRHLARTLNSQLEQEALSPGTRFDLEEARSTATAARKALKFLFWTGFLGYLIVVAASGTSMQGYLMEWLNLLLRWAHVVAGIMWIGASFYFIFLENNLNRIKDLRPELAGNLWAIHGGGFYFLEKYKVAPKEVPKELHWFKYEAYFTWLSGFALLIVVYYADARVYLIDPSVAALSAPSAIGIGLVSMVVGWIAYDLLCRSSLIRRPAWFAVAGSVLLLIMTYVLTQLLSGRAAYIHVGAVLGTIMAGNVFFTIIPSQKALVRAAKTGMPLDPSLGMKAGVRSLHNNYITLPVVFIMISNHFPSSFGHPWNWMVLMVIAIASASIKHYWNLLDRGSAKSYVLVFSSIALLTLIMAISPAVEDAMDTAVPVSFQEANTVIQAHCVSCHSANPNDELWTTAPNGVMYDTPEQIQAMADKIMTRAVRTHTMPQGNKTGMTEEERTILKRWILQGAKTP